MTAAAVRKDLNDGGLRAGYLVAIATSFSAPYKLVPPPARRTRARGPVRSRTSSPFCVIVRSGSPSQVLITTSPSHAYAKQTLRGVFAALLRGGRELLATRTTAAPSEWSATGTTQRLESEPLPAQVVNDPGDNPEGSTSDGSNCSQITSFVCVAY